MRMRWWILGLSALWALLVAAPLWAADVQQATVTLEWDAPTTNEDGTPLDDLCCYTIYYQDAADPAGTPPQHIADVSGTGETYTVTNLSPGHTYTFWVTAVDTDGNESQPSNLATATIALAVIAPEVATIIGCTITLDLSDGRQVMLACF